MNCACGCELSAPIGRRFIRGHNSRLQVRQPLGVRFWKFVKVAGPDACWLWVGSVHKQGYGYFSISSGHTVRAHRYAWELTNGPIPAGDGYHGTCVLHRCDVRACVNPAHLFLGSNQDNMNDMKAKGRAAGENSWKARLSADQVSDIRASHERPVDLAARYGVKPCTISNIRAGRIWKLTDIAGAA